MPVCSNACLEAGGSSFDVAAFQSLPQQSSFLPSGTVELSSGAAAFEVAFLALSAAVCNFTSCLKLSIKSQERKVLLENMRLSHVPAVLSCFCELHPSIACICTGTRCSSFGC